MDRRHFVKLGAGVTAGILLSASGLTACSSGGSANQAANQPANQAATPQDNEAFANPSQMSPELVDAAVAALKGVAVVTPVIPFAYASDDDKQVFLKLESTQKTGSFKIRGAYFKMSNMVSRIKQVGVTTCSAGNHAQGVAYSAQEFGAQATIFIPSNAPQEKINKTKSYGATVQLIDGNFEDAKAAALDFAQANGCEFIPPYDDYAIMAGQSTVAHEIMDDVPDANVLVVPVGGGGLISGIAYAAKNINPNIKIFGVQAENTPSMKASLEAGTPVTVTALDTLADGIHVARPGDKPFAEVQKLVEGVVTVTEDQIAHAIELLALEGKVVAEGAGATPIAALTAGLIPFAKGDKIVCVVSGGNVRAETLSDIVANLTA
ncbi:MAG: threonine/serine dehydratase [Coriobacteriia bacterium]|nr:threonine/serine dehydratase [Coriobacteriia bacterium]